MSLVHLVQLGRLAYRPALQAQHKFAQKLVEFRLKTPDNNQPRGFLLAVEHDPVYTIGRVHFCTPNTTQQNMKYVTAQTIYGIHKVTVCSGVSKNEA